MTHDERSQPEHRDPGAAGTTDVDPTELTGSTDEQLDELFRRSGTLPLDGLMNVGEHHIDLTTRTIYNDEHWKGWLPKGLLARDIFARLSTGYAKRFWKRRNKAVGETRYFEGRVLVNHALEEITLDQATNDLQPGRYILLRYTDAVFENVFYDVFKALNDGVIIYRGYTGRYPDGKRGFTGLLMRKYSFAEMGVKDHQLLFRDGKTPSGDSLQDSWRVDVITTADLPTPIAQLTVAPNPDGGFQSRCDPVADPATPVPPFVLDHFKSGEFSGLESELRKIDEQTVLGRWTTDLRGSYSKLLLVGSPGLFHTEREKGKPRRFTMHYILTRRGRVDTQ